jgi:hypothetical protein
MKIETYEQWSALTKEEKRDYGIEILKQIKYDKGYPANLEYWNEMINIWETTNSDSYMTRIFHRIITEPEVKYKPFTLKTIKTHVNRWYKHKNGNACFKITQIGTTGISYNNLITPYDYLLDNYEFIDLETGKTEPFGEKVDA